MKKNEVTSENIHEFKDDAILQLIGCFGRAWNPHDADCQRCIAQHRCVHRLAIISLPQEALERQCYDSDHELGTLTPVLERLDLNELAPEFGTEPRALEYAVKYAKNIQSGLPIIQADGSLIPSFGGPPKIGGPKKEEVPDINPEELAEIVETLKDPPPAPKPKKGKRRTMKDVMAAPTPEATPLINLDDSPKKKRGRPKKLKIEEGAGPSEPAVEAAPEPPVQTFKVVNMKDSDKESLASTAENPGKYANRFKRDCEKYDLPMGHNLVKTIKGVEHVTRKMAAGYLYNDTLYPTLLAVSMAQGNCRQVESGGKSKVTANMSANRWFTGLKISDKETEE